MGSDNGVGDRGAGFGLRRPGLWLSAMYLLCLHPNFRQITAPLPASMVLSDSLTPRVVGDPKTGM